MLSLCPTGCDRVVKVVDLSRQHLFAVKSFHWRKLSRVRTPLPRRRSFFAVSASRATLGLRGACACRAFTLPTAGRMGLSAQLKRCFCLHCSIWIAYVWIRGDSQGDHARWVAMLCSLPGTLSSSFSARGLVVRAQGWCEVVQPTCPRQWRTVLAILPVSRGAWDYGDSHATAR